MSFFTRQEEVRSGTAGTLRTRDELVSERQPRSRSSKWPLRWVTLAVVTLCSAFWITFFALIF